MMSETTEDTVKRKGKPNWSQDQLLAQFVLKRRGIIKGKFGCGVTRSGRHGKKYASALSVNHG